ncbi:MAG TPA: hypothetical protein DCL77_14640 [Prolixibacteraceae bacterium]|jgi:hypothetical protein|nr:hypothetical protein [Prolixibacteraceae bacterium]
METLNSTSANVQTKKLSVTLSQTIGATVSNETFTVNVLSDSQTFSSRKFRSLFQHAANKVLQLDGKLLSISKGRRFKMSIEFEGLEISKFETFYNSNEKTVAKFNTNLKNRLEASIMDIKDLLD